MGDLAQYLGVTVSNLTRNTTQCLVQDDTLCNSISCWGPEHIKGSFNMTFLPCGAHVGWNAVSGDDKEISYNITVYQSGMVNFSESATGNVTLEQRGNNVTFQVCKSL